ncbi:MAG: hypothetical protein ABIU63_02565 [Chitinophagaceae bacterium]
MRWFMKSIEIKFRYWGDMVRASVFQQEDARGVVYPIKLNGDYSFTLRYDSEKEWLIEQEKDGVTPRIDKELLNRILKPLESKLKYAA